MLEIKVGSKCPFCDIGIISEVPLKDRSNYFIYACRGENPESRACNTEIMNDMIGEKLRSISLIGAKYTSKTNYMHFLVDELNGNRAFRRIFNLERSGLIDQQHINLFNRGIRTLQNGKFLEQSSGRPITWVYRLIRNNKSFYLPLKDTPGEGFNHTVSKLLEEYPNVDQSDGLMLLIDPMHFDKVRRKLPYKSPDYGVSNYAVIENLYNAFRVINDNQIVKQASNRPGNEKIIAGKKINTLFDMFRNPKKNNQSGVFDNNKKVRIPIAICVAKFDLLEQLVNYSIPNYDYFIEHDGFSNTTEVNMQRIKEKSNILRMILDSLDDGELVSLIESKFSDVRYFPIHLVTPDSEDSTTFDISDLEYRGQSSLRGVLTPLIWLLGKYNFI